jgi:hypothetical protein
VLGSERGIGNEVVVVALLTITTWAYTKSK